MKIKDFMDVDKLQRIQDRFSDAIGLRPNEGKQFHGFLHEVHEGNGRRYEALQTVRL